MPKIWNFSNKKIFYWSGLIGFFVCMGAPSIIFGINILTFNIMLLIPLILYLIFDRKICTKNRYKIEKISVKVMVVFGNVNIVLFIILMIIAFMKGLLTPIV